MANRIGKSIFIIGAIATEVVRAPHRARNRADRRAGRIKEARISLAEVANMVVATVGLQVIPAVHVFSRWFSFANYRLPAWASAAATVGGILATSGSLWLLWRAHKDLGSNWSPTLEVIQEHQLVTSGVYGHLRHPIYAAVWLAALGQLLLLRNWIAGPAGVALFMPVYLYRVPREERMMREQFGAVYERYELRTGGIIPAWPRPASNGEQ